MRTTVYAEDDLQESFQRPAGGEGRAQVEPGAEKMGIQMAITDCEPISCYVGHKLGLPVLSIDNQHSLIYGEISYSRQYRKEAAATKIASRMMTPQADAYFVTSFFTPQPKDKRTFFFHRKYFY